MYKANVVILLLAKKKITKKTSERNIQISNKCDNCFYVHCNVY